MKSFWVNGCSGREERWAVDGHRWVAAEPRENGFDLWGYQDDTEIVYLGSGDNEDQLEKLADQFSRKGSQSTTAQVLSLRKNNLS